MGGKRNHTLARASALRGVTIVIAGTTVGAPPGGAAIGARAQTPPDAEGVDDGNPRARAKEALDEPLRGIRLPRPRGADDRNPVVECIGRKDPGIDAARAIL
jgi:hypothetical protein